MSSRLLLETDIQGTYTPSHKQNEHILIACYY